MKIAAQWSGILATSALLWAGAGAAARADSIGDFCPGSQIGMHDTDQNSGDPMVCDSDYTWQPDIGQVPHHQWADDQAAGN